MNAARPERPRGTTPPPRDERGPRGRDAHRGHGKHHEAMVAALAKATGKSEGQVKTALTQLAKDRDAEHEQREAALVKALAQQLGLSERKVAAAVEAARPAKPSGKHRPGYATP